MVSQFYQTEVNNEHVIRGNSAIIKCVIPSFVADFVSVASWVTDDGQTYVPQHKGYGNFFSPLSANFLASAVGLMYFSPIFRDFVFLLLILGVAVLLQ